jgi:hypothetical protein
MVLGTGLMERKKCKIPKMSLLNLPTEVFMVFSQKSENSEGYERWTSSAFVEFKS